MSQDQPLGRKEKKAQRDAERRRSGKKRKREEIEEGDNREVIQQDFIPLDVDVGEFKEQASKSLSSLKKRKLDGGEAVAGAADEGLDVDAPKAKKRRKQKNTTTGVGEDGATADGDASRTKSRFVCFIGNLPYNTTDASLQAHFKKLMPFTLRHRTDPKTKRSKGFAFLEFENYDRMKTCLKLYHHTMFDPNDVKEDLEHGDEGSGANAVGKKGSKKKTARRINVELTAGGGGKNAGRKEKIKVKNERLNGQRQRRADAERLEREKEAKEGGGKEKGGEKKKKQQQQQQKEKVVQDAGGRMEDHTAGMHPSRLARLAA